MTETTAFFPDAHDFVITGGIFNQIINMGSIVGGEAAASRTVPVQLKPNSSIQFTGRKDILTRLKNYFMPQSEDVSKGRKQFLLYGMGGIGKTQICLKFIEDMDSNFCHVFWVDASSAGTINQSLKAICSLSAAQSSGVNGSPQSALQWIGSLKDNFLLVFDNADTIAPEELEHYFPPGIQGNVLITSRNPNMQRLTLANNSVGVLEMAEDDAITLLLKASFLDISNVELRNIAKEIVNVLCCLPLAVDQAGAFIGAGSARITDYLRVYSYHRQELLSKPFFKGASKYDKTVYGTWDLSFAQIQFKAESGNEAAQTAILILRILAFFHHDAITEEIFEYAAQASINMHHEQVVSVLPLAIYSLDTQLLSRNKDGTWDNFIFIEGIQILLSFSFIRPGQPGMYSVHPLVHAWSRDSMTIDEMQTYWSLGYVTLVCSLSGIFEQQPYAFRRGLVTHIRANIEYSRIAKLKIVYYDDAYQKLGKIFYEQGYNGEAEELGIKVLEERKRILGEKHQDTMTAAVTLALIYGKLGKYTEAEELVIQVLDERRKALGEEHPDTIWATANLAVTHSNLGKYREAERLQIQVLDITKRILGEDHPDSITAKADLAITYMNLGKYMEAEKLQKQVLDARKILGEDNPATIRAIANLAATYGNLGRYTEAKELEKNVLDARRRILGEEHPDTIWTTLQLAIKYGDLGNFAQAETLQLQVLDTGRRVLGEDHPHTVRTTANLATTYRNLGKYMKAEELEIQVLGARKRILGEEHPDTMTATANLALTYGRQGKYKEAKKLEMKVLDARRRILGEDHPDTIRATANLAGTYGNLEEYVEAEKLEIQVLDVRMRILGHNHPDTIRARANLAGTCGNLGKYIKAEKLKCQVLEERKRILGECHPDTIRAKANLAVTYGKLKKYTEAEVLERQALDERMRILGEEHLDTIRAKANLAVTYGNQEKYAESEELEIQVLDARRRALGPEHPETIWAAENLAATYLNLGNYGEAEKLQVQILDRTKRFLGEEHPDTIDRMIHLSQTLKLDHHDSESIILLQQAIQLQQKVLGYAHPKTIESEALFLEWTTHKQETPYTSSLTTNSKTTKFLSKIPHWLLSKMV